MKKIIVLLLVIFTFFTTFVSAQDTGKGLHPVTFTFEKITLVKDSTPVEKKGHFELTFSSQPGIIFFKDLDKVTLMKIVIGQHVLDQELSVCYKGEDVSATAMCFSGQIEGMDIIFSTVLLNNKDTTVYAFGIALDKYAILMKVKE